MRPDLPIRKFTELVGSGRPIQVFGDGSTARDFTFIDDAVSGIVAALSYDCHHEVFNIATSSPVELLTVIRMIENNLGRVAEIQWLPANRATPMCCSLTYPRPAITWVTLLARSSARGSVLS